MADLTTEPKAPLLLTAMQNRPTGHVVHEPFWPDGTSSCATFTSGFLNELDEWVRAREANAWQKAHDDCCGSCYSSNPCRNPFQ